LDTPDIIDQPVDLFDGIIDTIDKQRLK